MKCFSEQQMLQYFRNCLKSDLSHIITARAIASRRAAEYHIPHFI